MLCFSDFVCFLIRSSKVYFSELTFSPCGGFMPFVPEEWDAKLGKMVNIRKVK